MPLVGASAFCSAAMVAVFAVVLPDIRHATQ